MKKQRIFLHTLILVLAAACFGTAAYGWTKYANVKAKNEYRWEYQDQYETLVTDSLQDIVAQYLYIKNFSDNKKVLVESSEYGNLTAKAIYPSSFLQRRNFPQDTAQIYPTLRTAEESLDLSD
jgi:hypothetical protein